MQSNLFLNISHGHFVSLYDIAFQQVMSPELLPRFPLSTVWVLILVLLTHPGLLISKLLNLAHLSCCWHYYLPWSTLSIIQDLDASLALSFLSYLSLSWHLYRVCFLLSWRLYRVCFLCLAVLPRPTALGGSTPTNCTWRFCWNSGVMLSWRPLRSSGWPIYRL